MKRLLWMVLLAVGCSTPNQAPPKQESPKSNPVITTTHWILDSIDTSRGINSPDRPKTTLAGTFDFPSDKEITLEDKTPPRHVNSYFGTEQAFLNLLNSLREVDFDGKELHYSKEMVREVPSGLSPCQGERLIVTLGVIYHPDISLDPNQPGQRIDESQLGSADLRLGGYQLIYKKAP